MASILVIEDDLGKFQESLLIVLVLYVITRSLEPLHDLLLLVPLGLARAGVNDHAFEAAHGRTGTGVKTKSHFQCMPAGARPQ